MSEMGRSPEAILLVASSCPHCLNMVRLAGELVKDGQLANLVIHNLDQSPDVADKYKARSVPWLRIGDHVLTGAQTKEALLQRIQWINDEQTIEAEFDYLLSEAQADEVLKRLKDKPKQMQAIMNLLSDSGTVLSTRIGIGVVIEEFQGTDLLRQYFDDLSVLAQHSDARIRADACHYLGLSEHPGAIAMLEQCIDDTDPEVREVVMDSLDYLQDMLEKK